MTHALLQKNMIEKSGIICPNCNDEMLMYDNVNKEYIKCSCGWKPI